MQIATALKTALTAPKLTRTAYEMEMVERRERFLTEQSDAAWRAAFSSIGDFMLKRKLKKLTPMQQALLNNPSAGEFEELARKVQWKAERQAAREAYLNRETQPSPFPHAFEHLDDGSKYGEWYAQVMQVWRARKRAELKQAVMDIAPGHDAHQDARIEMTALRHELLAADAVDGLKYIDQVLGPVQ